MAEQPPFVSFSNNLTVISRSLIPLETNEYIIAFGPSGRYLFGTENGYTAGQLPETIVNLITSGVVKRVVWVSFGSQGNSWFFVYEDVKGSHVNCYGSGIPESLCHFVNQNSDHPIRIHFGANNSYVAWTRRLWTCSNVPDTLETYLKATGSSYQYNPTMGSFRVGYLANVTWHQDGSYVVMGHVSTDAERSGAKFCVSHIGTGQIKAGWMKLWNMEADNYSPAPITELAYASIDPYSDQSSRYVFIKSRKPGEEVEFVSSIAPPTIESSLRQPDNRIATDRRLPSNTQWARSTREGRPTPGDTWELNLKVGERVKIISDRGNGWFLAENAQSKIGFAHRSSLDFSSTTTRKPSMVYARFEEDMGKLFGASAIRAFPRLSEYVDACELEICRAVKRDPAKAQICVHDLEALLRGSSHYSYAFLKEERIRWHPDKFGRFSEPSLRPELQRKSESVFVMIGTLMERMKKTKVE